MLKNHSCPTCGIPLDASFCFCPNCGNDLKKTIPCSVCERENENSSKFCSECGNSLSGIGNSNSTGSNNFEVNLPPISGITIEFGYSSSQTYELALVCAKKFPTFTEYGLGKSKIYRVTFSACDVESALELAEYLKGWRRRVLYIDGEKVTWDSVFSFSWCYENRKGCFKPDLYCFGYERDYEFNFWGCLKSNMPFVEYAEWFCFGNWLNNKGDWQFDKERIRHELQKNLYRYRFCPAMKPELVEDVIRLLPDVVNPNKDKNWKFRWGSDDITGVPMTVLRHGVREKVIVKGVSPNGRGALKDIAERMKNRLPDFQEKLIK